MQRGEVRMVEFDVATDAEVVRVEVSTDWTAVDVCVGLSHLL